MTFIYGAEGVIGFMINGISYLYRKNLFGDVTEIYNETRQLVGKYSYTAFGECKVEVDEQGIATKNPIRYRSYYYDEEINLYYLQTRYYDPEIGRFVTIDDVQYISADTINGLNLYAYCANNPVMGCDPDGRIDWRKIFGWIVSVVSFIVRLPIQLVVGVVGVTANLIAGASWSDLGEDLKNLNPFNQDESVATKAKIISYYKGALVIRHDIPNTASASILGTIFLNKNHSNAQSLTHEWGHTIQELLLGPAAYIATIAIPSVISYYIASSDTDYYSLPWERTAEWFGGNSLTNNTYHSGSLEWAFAYLFGIMAIKTALFFFLI